MDIEQLKYPIGKFEHCEKYSATEVRTNIKVLEKFPAKLKAKTSQLADNQALESGYYELQLDGKTEKLLAFNHDNKESLMDFYTPDELRNAFAGQKNIQVFDNLQDGDFIKTFQEQNIGTALWKYCLWAALAFLLIEVLLIRFMKA